MPRRRGVRAVWPVRHAELAFWAGDHLIKIPPFPTFSFFCSGIWAWDARQGKMCGGVIASPIFFLASYWIDRRTDVLLSSSSSSTTFFVFTTSRARVRAAFSFSNSSSLSFATLASTKCFLFSLYGPAWMGITWHYYSQVEKRDWCAYIGGFFHNLLLLHPSFSSTHHHAKR